MRRARHKGSDRAARQGGGRGGGWGARGGRAVFWGALEAFERAPRVESQRGGGSLDGRGRAPVPRPGRSPAAAQASYTISCARAPASPSVILRPSSPLRRAQRWVAPQSSDTAEERGQSCARGGAPTSHSCSNLLSFLSPHTRGEREGRDRLDPSPLPHHPTETPKTHRQNALNERWHPGTGQKKRSGRPPAPSAAASGPSGRDAGAASSTPILSVEGGRGGSFVSFLVWSREKFMWTSWRQGGCDAVV